MGIRTKITAVYAVLAVVLVASLGVFTSLWIESYFKERLIDDLSRQADLVQYILREDSTRSFAQSDALVRRMSGLERLRISLIDSSGNVLADSDVPLVNIPQVENHSERPEIRQARQLGVGHDIRRSATVGHDFLYMAKEVKNPPGSAFSTLSIVRLSVPYEDVQDQVNHIRFIVIVAGIAVLLVVLFASTAVSKRITEPMSRIAAGVEHIRAGNLDSKLEDSSGDEIGLVAKAVNELVEKLKTDIVQLKKLEQVRSQFLGNVSHELRTPLFAIQGYLETLLEGAIDDPSVNRSFLEKAQSNLDRLHTLLEDLINISQIESGEMKMSFRYFRVNEFMESVEKDFASAAATRGVVLGISLKTAEEDEMFGDRDRLRQVLNNLISNAISYNKPQGKVFIEAERIGTEIRIGVRDTGVGMPAEHLSRIFERFYRIDSDRSRALGGTGLGLAIVKHIVEAHGSQMRVESTPGAGSNFTFVLKGS